MIRFINWCAHASPLLPPPTDGKAGAADASAVAVAAVLDGAVVRVVLKSAMEAVPGSLPFRSKFLEILVPFDFPGKAALEVGAVGSQNNNVPGSDNNAGRDWGCLLPMASSWWAICELPCSIWGAGWPCLVLDRPMPLGSPLKPHVCCCNTPSFDVLVCSNCAPGEPLIRGCRTSSMRA